MDFELVAIAASDVTWIALAFSLGLVARLIGLPPLVGYLVTGFLLNSFGITGGETLQKIADLGVTLLLFTVGLKLNLKTLIRPQVLSVTLFHTLSVVIIFGSVITALIVIGAPLFSELDIKVAFVLAFALSFSSTVFAVKSLEEKKEINSLHGKIAISILVMQDIAAVVFLTSSTGNLPSIWAALLFLLIPIRPLFHILLEKTGHSELLILYGLVLALGGAELFEIAGVKDDLGALAMGILISTHSKSSEMSKAILGFKDIFLIGFFLSIGISGTLSTEAFLIGLLLVPFVFIKSALFFTLMTRFKLRSRTALLASLNLSNYSEFGLIVIAIGVSNQWLDSQWLVVVAIALSISFVMAASLTKIDDYLYSRFKPLWIHFQRKQRLHDDLLINTIGSSIAIFGMGRVGTGAYDKMYETQGDIVVGIDFDNERVQRHKSHGRKVLQGDPSDADLWEKIQKDNSIRLVMLALPNVQSNLAALAQLKRIFYTGKIVATARFEDEIKILKQAGATAVFNIHTEAGAGFAEHAEYNN